MKQIVIFILLFLLFSRAYGQNSTVAGKLYYQTKEGRVPASNVRLVVMPRNTKNLEMASNLYELFDDATIKKIRGARVATTFRDGGYELQNLAPGAYVLRVTGMGGMVIRFDVATNMRLAKIPDMPADYYNRKIAKEVYVKKS